MYARITTSQLKISHVATAASIWHKAVAEDYKQMNGFQSSYMTADRTNGKCVVVSFWDTEADARTPNSGGQFQKTLEALQDSLDESVPVHLEIYEVLAQI